MPINKKIKDFSISKQLQDNAKKYLVELIKDYKEQKEIWDNRKAIFQTEDNPYTKKDIESEMNYMEFQTKNTALYIANNLLLLDWENMLNQPTSYKDIKGSPRLDSSLERQEQEEITNEIERMFGNRLAPDWKGDASDFYMIIKKYMKVSSAVIDKLNKEKSELEKELKSHKGFEKDDGYERDDWYDNNQEDKEKKKPHCIGCKNSKGGVCKKHASSNTKLNLSNPEDMKEYKKQWRKKKQIKK